jgi:hypothetical protein
MAVTSTEMLISVTNSAMQTAQQLLYSSETTKQLNTSLMSEVLCVSGVEKYFLRVF